MDLLGVSSWGSLYVLKCEADTFFLTTCNPSPLSYIPNSNVETFGIFSGFALADPKKTLSGHSKQTQGLVGSAFC